MSWGIMSFKMRATCLSSHQNHQLPFFQNWRKTTCVLVCRSGNVWHSWVRESGILGRLATKTGEQ